MFYTYAYLREDKTPYYIGKGVGNRMHSKTHSVSLPPKDRRIILKQNMSEEDAFRHEVYMIAVIPNLRNQTAGGEGSSGRVCSDETRQKISHSNKGRVRTKQQRENMRGKRNLSEEELKRRTDRLPSRKDSVLSDETKNKISASKKGKKINLSDEQRRLRSERMKKVQQMRWG